MKPHPSTVLATWILEHLTFAASRESLAGDLLEQLCAGRPAGWFWRQVGAAVAIGAWTATRARTPALIFSGAWSMLYPAWRSVSHSWLPHAVPEQWLTLSWPYPPLLELACGAIPALTFIWIGLLLFLVCHKEVLHQLSALRLVGSLSASLNVLLLATLALVHHFAHPEPGLLCVTREHFYSAVHLWSISVPLALSIFVAICRVLPRSQTPPRRRRIARAWMDKLSLARYRSHPAASASRGALRIAAAGIPAH